MTQKVIKNDTLGNYIETSVLDMADLDPVVHIITTPGTTAITIPADKTKYYFDIHGGGGGAGSGRRGAAATNRLGGGGGSAGTRTIRHGRVSEMSQYGSTLDLIVGAGGAGGAAITTDNTDGQAGENGGFTSIGFTSQNVRIGYAAGGLGGSGGITGSSVKGGLGVPGMFSSTDGGDSISSGIAKNAVDSPIAAASGGGGAAISSTDSHRNANIGAYGGFHLYFKPFTLPSVPSLASGGSAENITATFPDFPTPGSSSPGGACGNNTGTIAGGGGGNGIYGSAGSGGGASTNGVNSGRGGNAGNGFLILIFYN